MDARQAADDRERLTRLWLQAESAVQAYIFTTLREPHDAEDLVQQVALTVARRFDEYDPSRPFIAWALWLAKSAIVDYFRKKGRERLVFSEALLQKFADVLTNCPQRGRRQEVLEGCVEKLPEKSRRLIELRYEKDSSMQAIAETLGSTTGSVRVMLFRVRNLLAECMTAELAKETT